MPLVTLAVARDGVCAPRIAPTPFYPLVVRKPGA
jgi:hypothetical protein